MTTFSARDFGRDLDQIIDQYVDSRLCEIGNQQQQQSMMDAAMNARTYVQAVISNGNARSPGFQMSA